jgi:hypothetical protein
MSDPTYQTVFLVASNIAFLLPAFICCANRMFYEATMFVLMCIISSVYHVVDSMDICLIPPNHLCRKTFSFLDFLYSFDMIFISTFLILNPTNSEVSRKVETVNLYIKSVMNCLMTCLALFLKLEGIDDEYIIGILSAICLISLIIAIVFLRKLVQIEKLDYENLIIGAIFIAGAYALFYFEQINYWSMHSLWHVAISLGETFIIEARTNKFKILYFLSCHNERFKPHPDAEDADN